MTLANSMTAKVQKMIEKINQTTQSSDTNLIDAINTLITKYNEISVIIEAIAGELGTINNPIVYKGNMTLEVNKYYLQDDVVYLCIKSSEGNMYHPLVELSEYVQIVT